MAKNSNTKIYQTTVTQKYNKKQKHTKITNNSNTEIYQTTVTEKYGKQQ
jgi:hypothetical protein